MPDHFYGLCPKKIGVSDGGNGNVGDVGDNGDNGGRKDDGAEEVELGASSVEDRWDEDVVLNGTQSGGMRIVPVESGWIVGCNSGPQRRRLVQVVSSN